MALTKITEVSLYAITSVGSNSVSYGSAVDVSTYYGIEVRIKMGRGTGTAFTTAPIVRIEGAFKTSPATGDWVILAQFQAAVGASIASQAQSSGGAAGASTIVLAAGTNFGAADYVFCHNGTLGNSEWVRVTSVSSATLTLDEVLVNSQSGATLRDQAEQYLALIDATSLQRVRLVIDASGSGQAAIFEAGFGAVSGL